MTRPFSEKPWCSSVQSPEWPFAYIKYFNSSDDENEEETKGRVKPNTQDIRHECTTFGVQSKCHICDDSSQSFQLQGVDSSHISKNIPTVSDQPWAVFGKHRYDFGKEGGHTCVYLSGQFPCQSNYGHDYSKCVVRCWGFLGNNETSTISSFGLDGYNAAPTRVTQSRQSQEQTCQVIETTNNTATTCKVQAQKQQVWPNHYFNSDYNEGVNATPWTIPLPSITWEYPKHNLLLNSSSSNPINVSTISNNITFLPQGAVFTLAGVGTPGFIDGFNAKFHHPEGVTVDSNGIVYVADTGNHAIRMVSSKTGLTSTLAGFSGCAGFSENGSSKDSLFSSPSDITVWKDWQWWPYPNFGVDEDSFIWKNGNGKTVLFICDTGNHAIRKITLGDNETTNNNVVECFAGCSLEPGYANGWNAKFDSPRGLAVSDEGDVYVADMNNHVIRKIDRFGYTTLLAGSLKSKEVLFSTEEEETTQGCPEPCLQGIPGNSDGDLEEATFSFPSDVALFGNDTLYVTDRHSFRKIDLVGKIVTTLAGGEEEGMRDGLNGLEAQFHKPDSLIVTSDRIAYVVDSATCRIRRISSIESIAPTIKCQDTLPHVIRPSGCSSYNPPIDDYGMKATPIEGNIHHNYLFRDIKDVELGDDYVGRAVKDCIGSPPARSSKSEQNSTEPLVLSDGYSGYQREDTADGTLLKISCPSDCDFSGNTIQDYIDVYEYDHTWAYSENSTICAALAHHHELSSEAGINFNKNPVIDVTLVQGEDRQLFTISISNQSEFKEEVGVQTISGTPSTFLSSNLDGCGYSDSIPPQEAKFFNPAGISAYVNTSLNDSPNFLVVADRNNHVIRAMTATCSQICENGGRCVAPDKCECPQGWDGVDCTLAVCSEKTSCGPRELCTSPNTCTCIPGFSGENCSIPTCVQECQNGGACIAPDTCQCLNGWFDSNCTTPVCEQTCGNSGNCIAPNKCECQNGWEGNDCRTPICSQESGCQNGGFCVAPNTCQCTPQYSGFDCSIPVCHQGYFIPFDHEEQKEEEDLSPYYWTQYQPCNFEKWCKDTNGFDCHSSNRKSYNIHEGSCTYLELGEDIISHYSYLINNNLENLTQNSRYSPVTPYPPFSTPKKRWNVPLPSSEYTMPWTFELDRQVALVELHNVTQGYYACANGGKCVAPEICACLEGWIGFDCRTPVCEQGFYEPDQEMYVQGTNSEYELEAFEPFLNPNNTYRLDPYDAYSNPRYQIWIESFINKSFVERTLVEQGNTTYLTLFIENEKGGNKTHHHHDQGGYSCSIRSVTEWEDYRLGYIHQHPNFYSRYMEEAENTTKWKNMQWPPTHEKSQPLEFSIQVSGNKKEMVFLYTNQGYRRNGTWSTTGQAWQKGSCIIEFQRVCSDSGINSNKSGKALDLQAGGVNVQENYMYVQDTDLAFRPRITYDNQKAYTSGRWFQEENNNNGICIDHVIRGCYNNGTCVAPNQCQCQDGWTGFDCKIPQCSQKCLHNGNCTLPNICTCEKGWTGEDCSIPICAQECNNFGKCVAPDTCKCKQWPNHWRDNRIGGGRPLFQKPNGDAQLTGWTGYDCSTPICVQSKRFRLNINKENNDNNNQLLVSLGGHGKNGMLECDDVRCPMYNKMVTSNGGRSFQTGCGYDPFYTGCCVEYESSASIASSIVKKKLVYTCYKCKDGYLEVNEHEIICRNNEIQTLDFERLSDIPNLYRDTTATDETPFPLMLCGHNHNPGKYREEYYTSKDPHPKPEYSNNNWQANFTSDRFLCNQYAWQQGDYLPDYDANLGNETGMGADIGLKNGRHTRINYNNYYFQSSSGKWIAGAEIAGEGIFECHNSGSCISPDICTCTDGWAGFDCRTPLCRHRQVTGEIVGCLNGGICHDKDNCLCIQTESVLWKFHSTSTAFTTTERALTGYTGSDCSMPMCVQGYFDPTCNIEEAPGGEGCYRCANGGVCVAPDVCQCAKGWTGFDCRTPVCEITVDDLMRKQLMTVDPKKVEIFEKDPCGMKDFYPPELVDGVAYARGNCTMPNQCTCFCKGKYNAQLCETLGGEYCEKPFKDPLIKHRSILAPNELFGTRDCWSGYEGAVDEETDFFRSCHMTIYEPNYAIRHTVGLITWGTILLCVIIFTILYVRITLHKRYTRRKIERRKTRRPRSELTDGGPNAFTYRETERKQLKESKRKRVNIKKSDLKLL